MAYTPTVWETGDVITAEKLNNIEGGIEAHDPIIVNGVYAAAESGYTVTFDISGPDMFSAISSGKQVLLHYPKETTASINEAYSQILHVFREDDGDGGYYYGAEDSYSKTLFAACSFSEGATSFIVSGEIA